MKRKLPREYEKEFVSAIFEIGLKNSSPKVLMNYMPQTESLTTEHIKSHLQKYRLHHDRSRDEFTEFYMKHIKDDFHLFVETEGWKHVTTDAESSTAPDKPSPDAKSDPRDESTPLPSTDPFPRVTLSDRVITKSYMKRIQELSEKMIEEQRMLQSQLNNHVLVQTGLNTRMQSYIDRLHHS